MTDPAQFEPFLLAYQDMVFTTAFRLLGNEAEAEDVSQEVFLKAWAHFPTISGSASAGGWLKTVTRNLCLNHLQRHRARWTPFTDLSGPEGDPLPMEIPAAETQTLTVLSEERRQILEAALARLPDHQRVPLVLYHFEDLDYADIASELGVSVSKVKTDLFRGREALRKKLQPSRADLGL